MVGNSRFGQWVSLATVLFGIGAGVAPSVAGAAGRVALVVGNGDYAAIGALPNPGNDAADVSAALGRLGFDVTTVRDADLASMNEALRLFARDSAGADVALVFYAGHGLEVDGVNYLVPVDARLERDTDVEYEALALDRVLRATSGASLRVVILDACRDNPLARSMRRTGATRSISRGSFGELDEGLLGDETLVAYAAAAGTTAADGTGRNSPYTAALLSYLERPLEIGILFREVRARVLESTDGEQRPHEYASLLGEHYLGGASEPVTVTAVDSVSGAALTQETVFWQSIAGSENPADFEAYLAQFPAGVFARLARNRMAELGAGAGDPPIVERPRPGGATRPSADRPVPPTRGREFRDCDDCPEMVVVPAGRFRMGCVSGSDGCWDDERPVHDVEVASFALSKYEVTRGQFAVFAAATAHEARGCGVYAWQVRSFARDRWEWEDDARASWREPGFDQRENEPVTCVSWEDAQAYVRWLSAETGEDYRLPSEAEWEYAARAGTTTRFYWGTSASEHCAHGNGADRSAERAFTRQEYRWSFSDCSDGAVRTALVGSYSPNAFGLYDMAGNVWGVGRGLLARQLCGRAAGRLGVDERGELWSPCVARRFLGLRSGVPAFGASQPHRCRRALRQLRLSCFEDARLTLVSLPLYLLGGWGAAPPSDRGKGRRKNNFLEVPVVSL